MIPRHLDLIYKVNYYHLQDGEESLVAELPEKHIRFSQLMFVMSKIISGVS